MDEMKRSYFVIIAFFFFSLILLVFAMLFVDMTPSGRLDTYDPQIFNLVYYVPLVMWVGIFVLGTLLIFSLYSPSKFLGKATYVFIFAMMLVIFAVFYGLPYLVESNPRFIDSWVHGRTAKDIIEYGKLDPAKFTYDAYPSSFILFSCLSMVTSIDVISLLRILPLLYIILFFSFFTLLVKKLLGNLEIAVISALFYGLSTFYLAFHFSPEITGWIFFFLFFIILAKNIEKTDKYGISTRKQLLILIPVLFGIATTHLVTQFSIILITLTMFFLQRAFRKEFVNSTIILLIAVIFLSYSLFFSISYISGVIEGFKVAIHTVLSEFTSSIILQPLTAYYPPEISNLLLYRRLLYIVVIATGLLGGFILWKANRKLSLFLSTFLFASLILVPFTVYGILPLERSIKIAFIPLSIFSAFLVFKNRKIGVLLLVFLILTIPINFASFYWNESSRYMTHDWEVASAQYLSSNFHGALLAEFKETTIFRFYGNFSKVYDDFYLTGGRPDIFNSTFIKQQNIKIVQITQLTILRESWAKRNLDINQFINSPSFNCIYSSEYSTTISNNNAR